MPSRPKRPCTAPACSALVDNGRCEQHTRGSSAKQGYGAAHRRWRAQVLQRDVLCVRCLEEDRVTAATVADHVIPWRRGGAQRDLSNGQGLCVIHHNRKTWMENR